MNFRAEAKTETSIVLSWSPPRQEIIVKYELLYREGEHNKEVSARLSRPRVWERGRRGRCFGAGLTSAAFARVYSCSSPLAHRRC